MLPRLDDSIALWNACHASCEPAARRYSEAEQSAREAELARLIGAIQGELSRLPATRSERDGARERITAAFVRFGRNALDFEDRHLDLLLGHGFSGIATMLARRARRFDPRVSMADILQASRNAWTACALQALLGVGMELTPAIFAYSMLYPYSDNFTDDAAIDPAAKVAFSERFGRRLDGQKELARGPIEETIWRLIELIEEQYPRDEFPQVFGGLLGIHRAQERSIRLLRGGGSGAVDVTELSFEKGGASVLADVYLALPSAGEEAAAFAWDWGILLQLGDDLEDLRDDRASGRRTVFTDAVARGSALDEVTSRTLAFGETTLARLKSLGGAEADTLKELIRRSSRSLLIRASGQSSGLYTPEYLSRLERFSPFRYAFLSDCRARLGRQSGALSRLFEAFLADDDDEPAFPLLPASLMQHL